MLEVDLRTFEQQHFQAARVWESAAGYAPTIGIMGAVLGLVHVMQTLSEPSKLGTGIAVAFVSTLYGVGLANLVFLPIAGKLKLIILRQVNLREMFIDGLMMICQRRKFALPGKQAAGLHFLGARMARRSRRQDEENHERWLISYADFITLLFALFVVLYAISKVDEGKYKVFSNSLNFAFGSAALVKPGITDPAKVPVPNEQEQLLKALVDKRNARLAEQQRKQNEAMQAMVNNLSQAMAPLVKSDLVSVNQTPRGVVLDINASALFEQGEATIQRSAVRTLTAVAKVLESGTEAIEVEGHTDDIPIFTPQFPSNWELSAVRASSVVRLFIEQGVAAERLRAVGLAAFHPVTSNETAEGRARNRRVTVTIVAPAIEQPVQSRVDEKSESQASQLL